MKQEERNLPVRLSEVEKMERSDAQQALLNQLEELEEEKKSTNAFFKSKMDRLKEGEKKLRQALTTGEEERPVLCTWCKLHREHKWILVRSDTRQTIEDKPFVEADYQEDMLENEYDPNQEVEA